MMSDMEEEEDSSSDRHGDKIPCYLMRMTISIPVIFATSKFYVLHFQHGFIHPVASVFFQKTFLVFTNPVSLNSTLDVHILSKIVG